MHAQGNFKDMSRILTSELGRAAEGSVDGILLDLGMSSIQARHQQQRKRLQPWLTCLR